MSQPQQQTSSPRTTVRNSLNMSSVSLTCELCQKENAVGKCRECSKTIGATCAELHAKIPVCADHVISFFTDVLKEKKQKLREYAQQCAEEIKLAERVEQSVLEMTKKLREKEQTLTQEMVAMEKETLTKIKNHFAQQKEKLHIVVASATATVERTSEEAAAFVKVTKRRAETIDNILKDDKAIVSCEVEHLALRRSGMSTVNDEVVNIFLGSDERNSKFTINLPFIRAFETSRSLPRDGGDQGPLVLMSTKSMLHKIKDVEVGNAARKSELVNGKLWVLSDDGLQIVDPDSGKVDKTISTEALKYGKAFTCTGEDIIITTRQGLAHCDMDGTLVSNINDGNYCDVTAVGLKVYAMEYKKGEVQVFKKNKNGKWSSKAHIQMPNKAGHLKDTVAANNNFIVICSFAKHCLYRYSVPSYELLSEWPMNGKLQLAQPRLCCMDKSGAVLVSDLSSANMAVEDSSGNSEMISISDMEIPTHAVLDERKQALWVISAEMENSRILCFK